MKYKIAIYLLAACSLSSCHIYKSYERPELPTDSLYRKPDIPQVDTLNFGSLSWREVFTDPKLQCLIEKGLTNNTDLQIARLRIKEAEATLLSSKLAYLPGISLAPQGSVSSFDKQAATKSYQLPVTASWEIDIFGGLLNAKRKARAALEQSEAYRQAVQTQLIASIANSYYTLLMLDKQLAISEVTAENWRESVKTMREMKEAGMTNEAAVTQSEANYRSVEADILDLKRQIRETENALSVVLGDNPQHIDRSKLENIPLPTCFSSGVPLQLLSNRPDVKQAEMSLAMAYYGTNAARSAFYPSITINGTAGWTNNVGESILNPGKFLLSAIGSLVQPLFNKGKNIANLKIAKAQQEEALLSFKQSLLNAGAEVSDALYMFQSAGEKGVQREIQVSSLEKSVDSTTELFLLGTSTYLEVLTAQQSLFSAQLLQVSDRFEQLQAVINLYHALGGGRKDDTSKVANS